MVAQPLAAHTAEPQAGLHGEGGEAVRAQPVVEVKARHAEMLQATFSQPESMYLYNVQ